MIITKPSRPLYGLPSGITALCIVFDALWTNRAVACDGAQNIRLPEPVKLSAQQLAEFRAMPTLKVQAVNTPPMERYDEDEQTYNGIGTDILCFIANELGLSFEILPNRQQTVTDKIQLVQKGRADMFL